MRKIKYIIVIIFCFLTTGCLNYVELNDIGIVDSIGISKSGTDYSISINMLTPTQDNLNESKTFNAKAKSISEAFDKLYLFTEKDINLSHLELLLLDTNLEKNDYDNLFSFFLNRDDSRNTFNVVIVNNYSENNIFKYTSTEIDSLIITNTNQDGLVIYKTLDQVMEDILNISISYIPTVEIKDNIKIVGYRSIYKENKLLSKKESIIYNFLTNKISKCNLVDENLNIKVDMNNTNIVVENNKIKISITSTLTNYGQGTNQEYYYNKTLKSYIEEFLNNNDLSYFKNLIKKYNYKYYKNNKDIKLIFSISVNSKVNKGVKTYEK